MCICELIVWVNLGGYQVAATTDCSPGCITLVQDTGVRTSHSEFTGRVGEGTSIISSSYVDDHGHGTHVAGTALGTSFGVAKKATLHAVKVLDSSGSGSYSNIISGMAW
jgi:subtilisin family serine protease